MGTIIEKITYTKEAVDDIRTILKYYGCNVHNMTCKEIAGQIRYIAHKIESSGIPLYVDKNILWHRHWQLLSSYKQDLQILEINKDSYYKKYHSGIYSYEEVEV